LSDLRHTIAIDYTPAYEQSGGIGRYVRELVQALAQQESEYKYRLLVLGGRSTPPRQFSAGFEWKLLPLNVRWMARIWHRARIPLPVETFVGRVNIFHATDFVLPPTLPGCKTILTVHDLSFVRVPESASPRLKAYLDEVVPRSVARADHVLADSEATKQDLIDIYGTSADKITVLLSGVDRAFRPITDQHLLHQVRTKYGIPEGPYVFSVGTVQPRKNYERLMEAIHLLREKGIHLHIVIAGGKGWLDSPIYARIHSLKMQDQVHFIGFADEVDLPVLYSGAICSPFVSLYEGFGIPILEAMACGTPVVTSNISSMPKVAGDAALLVDPYDVEAIAEAIRQIAENHQLRITLINKGIEHAKNFTWEKSAHHLNEIYRIVLQDSKDKMR
jgi:glycosyltransferase involved in cell wall biosynthesis